MIICTNEYILELNNNYKYNIMSSLNLIKYLTVVLLWGIFINGYSQESMLCIGDHWTEDHANLMMKEFSSAWNGIDTWEQRAKIIKEGIIRGMKFDKMLNVDNNLNPIIRNSRLMDGYIVENISIESFPGFYVTGNLYRPAEPKEKNAAILCPHGHWINRRLSSEMQIRCGTFARMGAIVFAYDMIGFGESKQVNHDIPIALLLQTWNSKRILDYLLSRPDVDAERIGITGASGGGTQSFMLTAIDDRIKVSVPVVQVSAHFFGGCICESGMPIHRSKVHQTNNVEIAALCAPRPMLLISDGNDWTRNTPLIEYPYIKKVYSLYNAEHKVENVHFPLEIHDYGRNKRFAVYNFFFHHLGLDISGIVSNNEFDESFITVLPEDSLKIFTKSNPIPGNALMGDNAVIEYLDLE